MNRVFADSYFFFAILNPHDAAHEKAIAAAHRHRGPLVTTAWVLTEVADGLANTPHRKIFRRLLDDLESNKTSLVVPANSETFEKGVELYHARPDEPWSLTDCISFVVMQEENVTEALTGDRHFEQAGFTALLK
ncbi:MAG: PIN domain-containing protein [Thermoguttaceae bacterium]